MHLLFKCDFSFHILLNLIPDVEGFLFRPTILQLFEFLDEVQRFNSHDKNFSFFVICCLVYFIWRERNDRRFSRKHCNLTVVYHKIVQAISAKATRWKNSDSLRHSFPTCFPSQFQLQDGFLEVSGQ
ncbi:hypothetical protein KFK09_013750 [Dendrobium nobile]|uniref:Uncharacterized protein n=1 Tax=Dendrobium nobile TaxID=94219 RepID=A0A8T3B9T7_DENNO|nr:hypothetical protein KFK09_013750 [Dendrobium nobile]